MIHHGPVLAVEIISVMYFLFAIQMIWQTPPASWKKKGPRAVLALVLVFVLCAFSGYTSTLLGDWVLPYRDGGHWALAVASIWLVVSNQSRFIANMMRDDNGHS